jgi:hypothetical protein
VGTTASGLTAAQASGLGTAATAITGAAATPQGQQVIQELESVAPALENEAQVIAQEAQAVLPRLQSVAPQAQTAADVAAERIVPAVQSVATSAFSTTEAAVVEEVRAIPIGQLRAAFEAGGAELNIGGRTILVDPGVPASGMTLFGENGFILGREAFTSQAELTKTLLHETFRLVTSQSAAGVSGELASSETNAAFTFAERAFQAFFK